MLIVHIISSLNVGGAEINLVRLCLCDRANKHIVISLTNLGYFGKLLKANGVKVFSIQMNKNFSDIHKMYFLFKIIKRIGPDVVQTWMYHADLIGGIIGKIAGVPKIFWNIRNGLIIKTKDNALTFLIMKICSLMSFYLPNAIVCNSRSGFEVHRSLGYKKEKLKIIENGFDFNYYKKNERYRKKIRKEFESSDRNILFAMIARFDPCKDHSNLLSALSLFAKDNNNFKCLLVGEGTGYKNRYLTELIKSYSLENKLIQVGIRADIPALINGLDILLLSSSSEGFPNVLVEAMACEVPCIATDTGDSKYIIGQDGWTVPIKKPLDFFYALCTAHNEFKNKKIWSLRKRKCRDSVYKRFEINFMVNKYNKIWRA